MTSEKFIVLPEGTSSLEIVNDDVFTEVSEDGEVYISYRIVRFTHALVDHPMGWTHVANVAAVHRQAIGVAHLEVSAREIVRAEVTLTDLT